MSQNKIQLDEKELMKLISNELPRLIAEHPEIRYEIRGIVADQFVGKDEFGQILSEIKNLREDFKAEGMAWRTEIKSLQEESNRRFEEILHEIKGLREASERHSQVLERHSDEIEGLREASEHHSQVLEHHSDEIEGLREASERHSDEIKGLREASEHHSDEIEGLRKASENNSQAINKLDSTIKAIGARWGRDSEESFRNALRGILTEELGLEVEQFIGYDEEGYVFHAPEQIELDVVAKNDLLILIEIKSRTSRSDAWNFHNKVKWYEKEHSVKVDRKIIISPLIEPEAIETINRLDIKMYTSAYDVEI